MTAAALEAKMKKDAPPPPYTNYDLLASPEFEALANEQFLIAQMSKKVEAFKGKGKIEGYEFNGGQKDLEAMIMASDVDRVTWKDGIVVKLTKGCSASTISTTKLVELGVSLDVIAAATVDGTAWTSVQMVVPKEGK